MIKISKSEMVRKVLKFATGYLIGVLLLLIAGNFITLNGLNIVLGAVLFCVLYIHFYLFDIFSKK